MAKYDQGGGCACGTARACDCSRASGAEPASVLALRRFAVGDKFEIRATVQETPEGVGNTLYHLSVPYAFGESFIFVPERALADTAVARLVERAPKPIAVGDRVRGKTSGTRGTVLAVQDELVWVRWVNRGLPLSEYRNTLVLDP